MVKIKENAKEFLDGPNVSGKFIIGFRNLFGFQKLLFMNGLVCFLVWAGIFLLFSLPWFIFVRILGSEIGGLLFLILGIIGFFVGFYIAVMLSYYFYISGWQD